MPEILVLGAGRIGRGFIAQLFHRAGWRLSFADANPALVVRLRAERRYRVQIAGRPEGDEWLPVHDAVDLADAAGLAAAVARADLLACAVGAGNLAALCAAVAPALAARDRQHPLDWLICENADRPAAGIRAALGAAADPATAAWIAQRLGLVETQVLRSGMDADPALRAREPLALRMHDWWTLPCDADAFRGPVPAVPGLQPRPRFANELQRKIYTFNGLNGPICYLGAAHGHRLLHEAAHDPALAAVLADVRAESAHGLVAEFGFDPAEQAAFAGLAWAKYSDPALADPIDRNARDSARKLGARERLVGPALLCLRHGREPRGYAAAVAAALAYRGQPDDAGTARVQADLAALGPAGTLARHAGIAADHPFTTLVAAAWTAAGHAVR